MIDKYGRTVTLTIGQEFDTYSVTGFSVSYPHGTPETIALDAINAMAPEGWEPPQVVPQTAPMWAVRTILQNGGMFEQAEAIVASSADNALKNIWEYGNYALRQSPSIVSLGAALGLSNEQIDAMFIDANNIIV